MLENVPKKKLLKIASILEKHIDLLEQSYKGKHQTSIMPIAFANGLNVLMTDGNFKNLIKKENRLKNAKIVRAAKNLMIEFEDFSLKSYSIFIDKLKNNINKLNVHENLAPLPDVIIEAINKAYTSYQIECEAFYNSLLIDIFLQGKMHQIIVCPDKNINMKKFANFSFKENEDFEYLNDKVKTAFEIYLNKNKENLINKIKYLYDNEKASKKKILSVINNKMDNNSYGLKEMFRKHAWQAYSFGNISQLANEKVDFVSWKTGLHLDDCLTCRAFETGEMILKDENGQSLQFKKVNDKILYKLDDILKLSNLEGPSYFCHDDCRCQFIAHRE